jgi:hypothetical protein
MAKSLDWRTVLASDVVRQIEDEMSRKFAEGWYAYERALQERMREVAPPPEVRDHKAAEPGRSPRSRAQPRVPRGYWDELIVQTLEGVRPERLAYTDLMARVQGKAHEHNLARSSFNVSLERLEREGKVGKDGHSWFWRAPRGRASPSSAADDTRDQQLSTFAFGDSN